MKRIVIDRNKQGHTKRLNSHFFVRNVYCSFWEKYKQTLTPLSFFTPFKKLQETFRRIIICEYSFIKWRIENPEQRGVELKQNILE